MLIKKLTKEYRRHEGLRSPALWVIMVYYLGRWSAEQGWPLRKLGGAIYGIMFTWFEFVIGSSLHREVEVGTDFHLIHGTGVRIAPGVVIGDRVGIMHDVTIGATRGKSPTEVPRIGNDVFIGAGAKILGPVVIGDHAIIGANSLVVSNVPAGATAVGVPARSLKNFGTKPGNGTVRTKNASTADVAP